MKIRAFLIAVGAVAAALVAAPAWADAVLRPFVVVTADTVRLGDLFDGVGDKANQEVAHAPAPGRRYTVDADWLTHVAKMNGLDWHTDDPFLELTIERSGLTIGRERIVQAITAALVEQGAAADAQIEIVNRDLSLTVPSNASDAVAVRELNYDTASRTFTALVEAPAGASDAVRLSVAGRIHEVEDVPVIAHPMGSQDVIAARDLTFVRMAKDTLRREVIVDPDQIIGMSPRANLRAGQTVQISDLQRPIVVARGALVTLALRAGAMTLTVQARANDQGSVGDLIRVTNTRSNQVVSARVDGPNQVSIELGTVGPPAGVASAN